MGRSRIFAIFLFALALLVLPGAGPGFKLKPCEHKKLFDAMPIPASLPIILMVGHEFRKGDVCIPIEVRVQWKDRYQTLDHHLYDMSAQEAYPGEFWYRTDREEFVLVADGKTFSGPNELITISASAEACHHSEKNHCDNWTAFSTADLLVSTVRDSRTGAFVYGYPTVITAGEEVPEAVSVIPPGFQFHRSAKSYFRPPMVEVKNIALFHADPFRYHDLIRAASSKQTVTKRVSWDNNEEGGGEPSHHKGTLTLEIAFSPVAASPTVEKVDCRKMSVRILYPNAALNRFVFDDQVPGTLTITAKAEAEPAEYADRIQWSFQEIQGSRMTSDPPDLRGPEVKVIFTGLPDSNNAFGPKQITATLQVDDCRVEVTQTVEIFYPIVGRNNPSAGTYNLPNWFYYWRQTPAARPENVGVVMEYRGRIGALCRRYLGLPMYYTPIHGGGTGRIEVCDLSNIDGDFFWVKFPRLSRDLNAIEDTQVGQFNGFRIVRFIDLFAAGLLHEYQHKKFDEAWRSKARAEVLEEDRDRDGIPDMIERRGDMRFIVGMKQSWFYDDPTLKRIENDEEWLAHEITDGYVDGTYDKYDWAKPGKQWPEP